MLIKPSHLIILYSFITLLSLNNINMTPPPAKTLQIITCYHATEFPSYPGQDFLTRMSGSHGRSKRLTWKLDFLTTYH